ncbi:MAG: aldo/keto reductase [Defluviitaleaceae bacterium]|nr:aldo/keto reductase [Defluviitaleaceae bacterium]
MPKLTALDYLNPALATPLGFGAMRLPPEKAELERMIDTYLDSDYNYFDTAYVYGGSEERLGESLVKRHGRDKYFVADKLPPWHVQKSPEDCEKLLHESLRRTGLEYIDFYLVHSLDDGKEQDVERQGLFEWCFEQKKKGLVRHVGFSFHGTTPYLARLLERHPDVEFVQLQQNYIDNLRGPAAQWQDLALKHNMPMIVMEPVRGGSLAQLPAPAEKLLKDYDPTRSIASWAIQYAATLEGASCLLSGMSNLAQLEDNLKTFQNLKPLTAEEMTLLDSVMHEIAKFGGIPCTACKYCHSECPINIDIATCFSSYNELKRGSAEWNTSMMYKTIAPGRRADACIKCGACVPICPQHIDIPKELAVVTDTFK